MSLRSLFLLYTLGTAVLGSGYVCWRCAGTVEAARLNAVRSELERIAPGLGRKLTLSAHGRDVSVSGEAATPHVTALHRYAVEINDGSTQRGGDLLRRLHVQAVRPHAGPATVLFMRDDAHGSITVAGVVPAEKSRAMLLAAARDSAPAGTKVLDALKLDEQVIMPTLQAAGLRELLRSLWEHTWEGAARCESGAWSLTGLIRAEEERGELQKLAAAAGIEKIDAAGLRVNQPEFPPAMTLREAKDGKATLTVRLPFFEPASRQLIEELREVTLPPEGDLSPQVHTAAWIGELPDFARQYIALAEMAELRLEGDRMTISGELPDHLSRQFLRQQIAQRFPGMKVTEHLHIPKPPAPVEVVMRPLAAFDWPAAPAAIPAGRSGMHLRFLPDATCRLEGSLVDEKSRAAVLSQARAALPPHTIISDGLTLQATMTAPALWSRLQAFFTTFQLQAKQASITWIEGHVLIRGQVADPTARDMLEGILRRTLPDQLITNQLAFSTTRPQHHE